jgi:F-type H+-transporting ATPase subunit b
LLLILIVVALPVVALASEGGGGHEGEAGKTYFGIPAGVLKFLNVAVFLGLLVYLLKGPVLGAFSARGEAIRKELSEAAQQRQRADRLAIDIQSRLDQIEKDVASIITRARDDGERQKAEIIEAAKGEAEKIVAAARGEVDARVKQARKELTDFAGELAADRAHAMIATSMTDADRRKVFDESVQSLAETKS